MANYYLFMKFPQQVTTEARKIKEYYRNIVEIGINLYSQISSFCRGKEHNLIKSYILLFVEM